MSASTESQPPLQFADYVAWLGSPQQQRAAETDLAWWTTQLADLQPLDPRSLLGSALAAPQILPDLDEAGVLQVSFPEPLAARLRAFARSRSTTPFIIVATVLKTLLMRVSGQSDIAILTPSAARPLEAFEGLLGCFLNVLVLRTDLGGTPSLGTLLERVRETVAEASQHAATGYDRVIAALNSRGQLARPPGAGPNSRQGEGPVQIYLNLDMDVEDALMLGSARARRMRPEARQARFDLAFDFDLTEDRFGCTIEYRRSRIAAQAVDRLAAYLTTLFEHALEHPEAAITRLPLVAPAEQAGQLEAWNATRRDYPDRVGVQQLILERAAVHPEALALVCGKERLTYRQLCDAASRLAVQLRRREAVPGRFVGICLERGPDMIIAMLATMMSGAAWVPLDPAYPVERLEMMADDASLLLVISTRAQADRLGAHPPPLLLLDGADDPEGFEEQREATAAATPILGAGPADPAYMIYTSGSTGRPKGVCIPHRALANFLTSMAQRPGLTAADQVLALTTLSFDISLLETLLPLVVGASVRIATREDSIDGTRLRALVDQTPVTLLQATPATWRILLDSGWTGKPGLKALVGGEALTAALARELQSRCRELWNMYGPTETTVWSTCEQVPRDAAAITIGRPIANTLIHIIDSQDQPCPIGVAGEILIGGSGLAIGYHERPELNRDRFIVIPHPSGPAVRFYRTGDLGRWVGDGRIEHMGRIDHQIKLRGHRIELGEIEHQLAEHPAVRQAVATVRELKPGDQRLVAFVVPADGQRLPAELRQWREFLGRQLPDYMLPQHIQVLDSLPLLPNGKVDRARLPMPAMREPDVDTDALEAPHGDTESVLAALWAEVLGIKAVGRNDDFFDLGGHSLLALRLLHRVEVQFGTSLRLATLFEAPTIAQMARLIEAGDAASDHGCAVVVSQGRGCPPLFFVSGWGGALLTFNRLGEELGSNQPLVVLDTSVFDGNSGSLAQIATRMIRDMRRLQPEGPYQLCGFSQGGKFVHEIACQLREAGEAVHLLAFLDCTAPDYPRKRSLAGRLVRHASNLLRQDWRSNLDYVMVRLRYFTRVALKTEDRLFVGRDSDVADSEVGRRMQEAADAVHRVWEAHVPRPYDGPLLLIRAGIRDEHAHLIDDDPYLGWQRLFRGNIVLREFEGTRHNEMLAAERAEQLAALLGPALLGPPRMTAPPRLPEPAAAPRASAPRVSAVPASVPRSVRATDDQLVDQDS